MELNLAKSFKALRPNQVKLAEKLRVPISDLKQVRLAFDLSKKFSVFRMHLLAFSSEGAIVLLIKSS